MSRRQPHPDERLREVDRLYAEGEHQKALEALEGMPETAAVLAERARNWFVLGQRRKALRCHRAIVERSGADSAAFAGLAELLTNLGRYRAAVRAYDAAIRLDPGEPAHHSNRARALWFGGNEAAALEAYDAALALAPDDVATWATRADLLVDLGRFPEAVKSLEKAAEAPRGLDAARWVDGGSRLASRGALDEALGCYGRALELEPNDPAALAGKAAALEGKGDVDGALAIWEGMTETCPDDARGWNGKANLLVGRRRLEEALGCYQILVRRDGHDKYALVNCAYCLLELKRLAEAEAAYRKAIEVDPEFPIAWEGSGNCLHAMGRDGEAVSAFRRALALDPDLLWANNNLGWVLADRFKKFDEALAAYDRAIALGPAEPMPTVNRALALVDMKRFSEAKASLEEALQRVPRERSGPVLTMLGSIHSERFKDPGRALPLYEEAARLSGADAGDELNIAEVLIRLGRHEDGRSRASAVLQGKSEPRYRAVASFLLYASHALQGDRESADGAFSDLVRRLIEQPSLEPQASGSDRWTFDGFIDTVARSSASLAAKVGLLVAIDLQTRQLQAPSVAGLTELAPLFSTSTSPDRSRGVEDSMRR